MRAVEVLRRAVRNSDRLEEISQGIANQSDLLNRKLEEVIQGVSNLSQSDLLNRKLDGVIQGFLDQSGVLNRRLDAAVQGFENIAQLLSGIVELQKGQLVMHREQMEAIEELVATIKQRSERPAPSLVETSPQKSGAEHTTSPLLRDSRG